MVKETGKSQVLIVDDERSIRITLKEFLEDAGFMVATADGFAEAIRLLAACDFDVAVVDRILSNGHSGLDIIEHIRRTRPLCQTILITAYPTFESAQDTLRNGSCDYLVKPVALGDICKAVKDASQTSLQRRREKPECILQ